MPTILLTLFAVLVVGVAERPVPAVHVVGVVAVRVLHGEEPIVVADVAGEVKYMCVIL